MTMGQTENVGDQIFCLPSVFPCFCFFVNSVDIASVRNIYLKVELYIHFQEMFVN